MKNFNDYRQIKAEKGSINEQEFMGPDPENIEIELVDSSDKPLTVPSNIPLKLKRPNEMGVGVQPLIDMPPAIEAPAQTVPPPPPVIDDAVTQDSLVTKLLNFLPQLRIFHWGTTEYPQHVASGDTYDNFDETLDKFVETYQGYYPRVNFCDCMNIRNIGDLIVEEWLTDIQTSITSLRSMVPQTDLQNELDELSGIVGKFKYLLTLK
jgi:hypothetical protein